MKISMARINKITSSAYVQKIIITNEQLANPSSITNMNIKKKMNELALVEN
jgi:hypothetical protein